MATALAVAKTLKAHLGLPMQAGYSSTRFVANEHGLIDPRGVRTKYDLDAMQTAEVVLCCCASSLSHDLGALLATVRETGVAECLASFLDHPRALADSAFVIDGRGRAIRVHRADEDASGVVLEVEQFTGGSPKGPTFTIDGYALAAALSEKSN